uniref:AIP/AIPL N-terminal FKBP-type PPIase domain-containing protein n=1 Tax=Anopheles epiroticus TaxID=199890 RepID=A0A182PFN2_9DIPT
MELVLGKKFKLEVWETIVQLMALHEVARFRCHSSLVQQYPFLSKTIRDAQKPSNERKRCCPMMAQKESLFYKDVEELITNPQDLEFTIEILSIESPNEYEKELWQLSDDEKRAEVEKLRERGNVAYRANRLTVAQDAYCFAVGIIEQLMLKEKPNEPEWIELARMKVPLLLNYSQCKLLEQDYYAVIEHCTEVLGYDPHCVKALFRRGKAHADVWNFERARADLQQATELDSNVCIAVDKELTKLRERQHLKDIEDRFRYQNIF